MTAENPYTADPLTESQIEAITTTLRDVARNTTKASLTFNQQTLLVQDMAYVHSLHIATGRFLAAIEDIPIPTLVRYAAKPDGRSDDLHAMALVDLDQYRAPDDLRGLDA